VGFPFGTSHNFSSNFLCSSIHCVAHQRQQADSVAILAQPAIRIYFVEVFARKFLKTVCEVSKTIFAKRNLLGVVIIIIIIIIINSLYFIIHMWLTHRRPLW